MTMMISSTNDDELREKKANGIGQASVCEWTGGMCTHQSWLHKQQSERRNARACCQAIGDLRPRREGCFMYFSFLLPVVSRKSCAHFMKCVLPLLLFLAMVSAKGWLVVVIPPRGSALQWCVCLFLHKRSIKCRKTYAPPVQRTAGNVKNGRKRKRCTRHCFKVGLQLQKKGNSTSKIKRMKSRGNQNEWKKKNTITKSWKV